MPQGQLARFPSAGDRTQRKKKTERVRVQVKRTEDRRERKAKRDRETDSHRTSLADILEERRKMKQTLR